MKHIMFAAIAFALLLNPASACGPSDAEVRAEIVKESVAAYKATGHPCACPDDTARNGSRCGGRSAYSRPGGAAPLCYLSDVTDGQVLDWRAQHK
jgi:hypothetical protein